MSRLDALIAAIDIGLRQGLAREDVVEVMGLRTAILTCLGTVPDNVARRAALEMVDRLARCHLFDPQRPLERGACCPHCARDAGVIGLVVLADQMKAPVGGLLERLLVVIGLTPERAREAVIELELPNAESTHSGAV